MLGTILILYCVCLLLKEWIFPSDDSPFYSEEDF